MEERDWEKERENMWRTAGGGKDERMEKRRDRSEQFQVAKDCADQQEVTVLMFWIVRKETECRVT